MSAGRLRPRAYLLAFVLAPAVAAWLIYGEIVLLATNAAASIVPTVLAMHFLLAVGNAVVARRRPAWALTTAEMVLVYGVTTLAAVLAGFDFLQLLPVSLVFTDYFGSQQETFAQFSRLLPAWYRPRDPELTRQFFQGGGSLADAHFWAAWAGPLAFWTLFVAVLLATMLSLNLLVRERWLKQERLPFPIVELPFTLSEGAARDRLFASRLFWIGLGGTFVLLSVNAVSTIVPGVPGVRLNLTNIAHDFPPPLSGAAPLYLSWQPFALGIAFFVPLDVLFSAWFFFVVRKALEVFGVVAGWREAAAGNAPGQFPFVREVAQGAWMGLAVVLLWGARGHFAEVWRSAFPARGIAPDLGYRGALLGAGGGALALAGLFAAAGLRPWLALVYVAVFFVSTLVMTRVFAQIGAPVLELYFFNAESLVLSFTGTRVLSAADAAILGQAYWFNHAYRQHPMGQELAALAMGERAGMGYRPLVTPLLMGGVLGTIAALVTLLACYHALGAATAKVNGGQLGVGGWELWNRAASWLANPKPPQGLPLVVVGVSAALCLALGWLGDVWIASPLRPVGLAFAFSYALDYIWNLFVVAWAVKWLLLRYGGLSAYRRATPLFLGLALGDALAQVLWGLTGTALGLPGVSPHLGPVW